MRKRKRKLIPKRKSDLRVLNHTVGKIMIDRLPALFAWAAALFVGIVLAPVGPVFAQQATFTSFRGTNGASVVDAKTPSTIAAKDFIWKTDLPGRGWSSPVYDNGKIWLTAAEEKAASEAEIAKKLEGVQFPTVKTAVKSVELFALCVDLKTGELLKRIELASNPDPQPINPMNSFASPTCAISGSNVICHFGADGTWCLDTETGAKKWHRKIVIDHSVGSGSSPVISDGKVILVYDGVDQQFVTAVSLEDGTDVWKTDRPPFENDNGEFQKAYSTPLIIDVDGTLQAVVPGAQWVCAYDVKTGEEIWRASYGFGFSVTPMAVWAEGLITFSTSFPKAEFIAIKPGKGDLTDKILWRQRNAPSMSSFIVDAGKIYAAADRPGRLVCVDLKTGKVENQVRLLPNVSASILKSGENLYLGNRDGKMKIVRCTPEMKEVGSFDFASPILATPTVVDNDLLVRTRESIIRIGKR